MNTGEQVLLIVHKHWAVFLRDIALILAPTFLAFIFFLISRTLPPSLLHVTLSLLFPCVLMIVWMSMFIVWMRYYLTMLVLTDRRVVYLSQNGLTQKVLFSWNIMDIKRLRIGSAGFFETYFGCGSISVETNEGKTGVVIDGIKNAEYVCAVILRQDDRYDELVSSAQKQHDLLRFISHEVKGHLTKSKAAFASIIEGDFGAVPAELDSMAQEALKDSQKGVETVMNILDNRGTAQGALQYQMHAFNMSVALHLLIQEFRPAAQKKHLTLDVSVAKNCLVRGDEQKIMRQVVRNLIDNAIRYTTAGSITVTLEPHGALVRLSVSDTGVGISPDDQERLFTQGGNGQHSKEINTESTGYGLFIARQVVEAHGGIIKAESSGRGQGARFTVELPLA